MTYFIHRKEEQVCCSVGPSTTNLYLQFKTKFVQIHRTVLILQRAARARGRNHITIRTIDQTELRIFIRFEVVDTLGSSQVLFSYQDFPPSQTVLSLQGLGILRRARGRNQYKYVAARQIIRLLWILDINYIWQLMPSDHFRTGIKWLIQLLFE